MYRLLTCAFFCCLPVACSVHNSELLNSKVDADLSQGEAADVCQFVEELPVVLSSDEHSEIDLALFTSTIGDLSSCNSSSLVDGNDGFVALDVAAGERWHIKVAPDNVEMDLALYTLDGCAADTCSFVMNRCGPGLAEEFTFVSKTAGKFVLGIDSVTEETGDIELLVLKTTCGSGGEPEDGEGCDDGNLVPGDGCDSTCRVELPLLLSTEDEPNNFHTEANTINLEGSNDEMVITGMLGGPCDTDHYALHIDEGANIYVNFLDGAGLACVVGHADVRMELLDPTLGVVLGAGTTGGKGGECPSLEAGRGFNEALNGGEYQLVVTAEGQPVSFSYQIQVGTVPQIVN